MLYHTKDAIFPLIYCALDMEHGESHADFVCVYTYMRVLMNIMDVRRLSYSVVIE